jgi:hypothetical protein
VFETGVLLKFEVNLTEEFYHVNTYNL